MKINATLYLILLFFFSSYAHAQSENEHGTLPATVQAVSHNATTKECVVTIRARMVDAETNKPVSGGKIQVKVKEWVVQTATTDDSGYVVLTDLPKAGAYVLKGECNLYDEAVVVVLYQEAISTEIMMEMASLPFLHQCRTGIYFGCSTVDLAYPYTPYEPVPPFTSSAAEIRLTFSWGHVMKAPRW